MSFFTAKPNFAGVIYKEDDLIRAREVMGNVFNRYAPTWLDTHNGILGKLWDRDDLHSVLAIIDVARTLFELSSSITPESALVFERKVKQLLLCNNQQQYEEQLGELYVGVIFGLRAGPVAYEPLARRPNQECIGQPLSPDFGIRLPDGDVLIETTTLRIESMDDWDRAIENIRSRINNATVGAGLTKEVEIHAPRGIRADKLTRQQLIKLVATMKTHPSGKLSLTLGPVAAQIEWRDIPLIELPANFDPRHSPLPKIFPTDKHFSAMAFTLGTQTSRPISAWASKVTLVPDAKEEELIFKSIRNTIDGKRTQLQFDAPTLLVLQSGQRRISSEYIDHLINKRIWPNKRYAWLTAIGVLTPRRSFEHSAKAVELRVSWNPKPKVPSTMGLTSLIEDSTRFFAGKTIEVTVDGMVMPVQ